MANVVLGLQGGLASGAEPTFDKQPMVKGTHLRWSVVPELGFPPGGFWLYRRVARDDKERLPPPPFNADIPSERRQPPERGFGARWGHEEQPFGWQMWGEPFTLPVTHKAWPARYFGAPDPLTAPPAAVLAADLHEARKRLGGLRLSADQTPQQEAHHLESLHKELVRLVEGFPAVPLPNVRIHPSPAKANAPRLDISLMEQLLFLALDPYFARVIGLYFVDRFADPAVKYDYCVVGYWGATPVQAQVFAPGLAPGAPLARGEAVFSGMGIKSEAADTTLWRWTKFDSHGLYAPRTDPTAPPGVQKAINASVAGLPQSQQPPAVLAILSRIQMGYALVTPAPRVRFTLAAPAAQVHLELEGEGVATGYAQGVAVASAGFNNPGLAAVSLFAASPSAPIDAVDVVGVPKLSADGVVLLLGRILCYRLAPIQIGMRYALLHEPQPLHALPPPGQPLSTFRHRKAEIDPVSLELVPKSLIELEWPATTPGAADFSGDPVAHPMALPSPRRPLGFVIEEDDSGDPLSVHLVPRWVAAASSPTPPWSKIPTPRLYRYSAQGLHDPRGGWRHRVAGFDIFGVRGHWSPPTAPLGVEKLAGAPTALKVLKFDNTAGAGGAPAPDGSSWTGGTLALTVGWAGASFLMYPDLATARITVQSVNPANGDPVGDIATSDLALPSRKAKALVVTSVTTTNLPDGVHRVTIETSPPLQPIDPDRPPAQLILTLADGSSESYTVRPAFLPPSGPVAVQMDVGAHARILTQSADFVGQTAYLVEAFFTHVTLQAPLSVPIDQTTAKGRVIVQGSTRAPFDPSEQIIDPNGVNPPRSEPVSAPVAFTAPQRLRPPAPPTPVHIVDHLYYDPADLTGRAGKTLPFDTSAGPASGVHGYVLQRAPLHSVILADIKRRLAAGGANNPKPVVLDGGSPRPDLVNWISSLSTWISAYNAANSPAVDNVSLLSNPAALRAFMDHFYGGLLDDELRALADIPENAQGFARAVSAVLPVGSEVSDTVDGTGFGRTLYRLAAVNKAGSTSEVTGAIGPYYTTAVAAPRPPVLYKVQAQTSAMIVAWSLDTNPDLAGYLVYRAADPGALADLRYFGPDPAHPASPSTLAQLQFGSPAGQGLAFGPGQVDPRIIGVVPDPRLFARDHQGSDMGEVLLPPGPAPDQVLGVYRLSDYSAGLGPTSQTAFNYWTPPAQGIAQVQTAAGRSRLTGLRLGLGRGVPVVVVTSTGGKVSVLGAVPLRRAGFVDSVTGGADPHLRPGAAPPPANLPSAYVVIAVDIHGNRSAPSKIFTAQPLALQTA